MWDQPWASAAPRADPAWGRQGSRGVPQAGRPESSGHALRDSTATLDVVGRLLLVHAGLAACSRGLGNRAWISGRLPTTSEAASGQEEARAPWGKAGTVVRRPMSAMRAGSWAQAGKGALGQHGHRVHRAGTVFTERGYVLAGDRSLPGASSRGERVWSTFLGDSSVMDGEGAGTSGARPDPWAPSRLGSRGPRAGLFLQAPASPGRAEHGVRLARLGPTLSFERKCGWLPSPPRDSHGMSECSIPLWGQNLLRKFKARVTFLPEQLDIRGPPTRACFEPTDGAHGNPRKGDGALSPLSYLLLPGRTQKHR